MNKDPLVYIDDILDSIRAIRDYSRDLYKEKFLSSPDKQDAVYRRLEIFFRKSSPNPLVQDHRYAECADPRI